MTPSPDTGNGTGPDWWIYRGSREPHDLVNTLPPPPPWRDFSRARPNGGHPAALGPGSPPYVAGPETMDMVNSALYLRRPLLVTGRPGTGKSSLAYSVARELALGPVLRWSITSSSTLRDGLYAYDAIGRLQDAQLRMSGPADSAGPDIGRYIQLGPLGTALMASDRPRVLLVDELDKSDIDLPNDLLDVFETGSFLIPELARISSAVPDAEVTLYDQTTAVVSHGYVQCQAFPFVIITSNGERAFPPAFIRRCLRLDIPVPTRDQLVDIIAAHLGEEAVVRGNGLIDAFLSRRGNGEELSTDQLLNALHMVLSGFGRDDRDADRALSNILRALNEPGTG
jgi:MoxR-like ATPase